MYRRILPIVFSARRRPDRIHGDIFRCARCGLVYPRSLIDTAELSRLYRTSAYTYAEQEKAIGAVYKRYLRRLIPLLAEQPRPLSYLDIGCGNGFMLAAARQTGFDDVYGVEPSSHAVLQADPSVRDRITEGMFSAELLRQKRFDAISCFQTLDHIPDPLRFLQDCFSVLKPGGAVLFINHNISSLFARMLGERCPMIDIEHTYLHTKQTMRMLFERSGFTDVRTFSVRNDYPVSYWLHLLPCPASLKNFLHRTVSFLHADRLIIPLYAGNLGLIARKPAEPSS